LINSLMARFCRERTAEHVCSDRVFQASTCSAIAIASSLDAKVSDGAFDSGEAEVLADAGLAIRSEAVRIAAGSALA
jgi:hypothetical protein